MYSFFAVGFLTVKDCLGEDDEYETVVAGLCADWTVTEAQCTGTYIPYPETVEDCSALSEEFYACYIDDVWYDLEDYAECDSTECGGHTYPVYFVYNGTWEALDWYIGAQVGFEWVVPGMTTVDFLIPVANETAVEDFWNAFVMYEYEDAFEMYTSCLLASESYALESIACDCLGTDNACFSNPTPVVLPEVALTGEEQTVSVRVCFLAL